MERRSGKRLSEPGANDISTLSNISTVSDLQLAERFSRTRRFTNLLAKPLTAEDCMIQSMPDASPIRWHMAHTTWFFETFVLSRLPGFEPFDEEFCFLFNSYYNSVGEQYPRSQRGCISRPGMERTRAYRQHVDEQMSALLSADGIDEELRHVIEVGLHHEQQHQELMLTDIKHAFSCNPLHPACRPDGEFRDGPLPENQWIPFDEGVYPIGHESGSFAFDNESPVHRVFLQPFSLARQPVTCGQYLEFIEDGGYQRPDHWLSLGWSTVQEQNWSAPLYWYQQEGEWMIFTLSGPVPFDPSWPVCHVSYFEADAFARWAGYRLPTEFEWEAACVEESGNQFADRLINEDSAAAVHPMGEAGEPGSPAQMLGGVWEWTSSSYSAYPGYQPPDGALGEYNGKFMCNQYVLRGGSVATSSDHIRPTYRNFFPPEARWQFSGIRLAK